MKITKFRQFQRLKIIVSKEFDFYVRGKKIEMISIFSFTWKAAAVKIQRWYLSSKGSRK